MKKQKSKIYNLKSISSSACQTFQFRPGFTIVELLVVIVVIGILAAIIVVSYAGITQKTKVASLQSDLSISSKKIKLFQIENDFYPYQINDCPSPTSTNLCLTSSNNATYNYTVNNGANPKTFTLIATADDGTTKYQITESSGITEVAAAPTGNSFAVAWGGAGYDSADYLIRSSDGGYVTVGSTESYDIEGSDAFIVKYNSDNTLAWNKTWGEYSKYDYARSVVEASDSGYVVVGETESYGAGGSDAFLAKYASDGTLSWSRTWGGVDYDYAESITLTSDGGYAIAGYTFSYGAGSIDAFIAKYTSDGTLSWSRTWGGVNDDRAFSIVETSDNGYAIAGYTYSYGGGDCDAFLAKYSSDGTLSWSRTWGGIDYDIAKSIIQTSEGDYVIAGATRSYGAGYYDAFIAKYSFDGAFIWDKTWGDENYDHAYSLVQTIDHGYVMVGKTRIYAPGYYDAFLAKYTSDGTLSWSRTWGGVVYEVAFAIVQTANDDYYAIAGHTNGYGAGAEDAFIAKYNFNGTENSCAPSMCQVPTPSVFSPSATVTSPATSVSSPTALVSSPVALVSSPAATHTVIVAP